MLERTILFLTVDAYVFSLLQIMNALHLHLVHNFNRQLTPNAHSFISRLVLTLGGKNMYALIPKIKPAYGT